MYILKNSVSMNRETLDLSGSWELIFDNRNEGIEQGWIYQEWPEELVEPTNIPAIWNLTRPQYEGVVFYRKAFAVPLEWKGAATEIQFKGASYRLEAWLNGTYLGSHEGSYTPFCFDITSSLRFESENILIVRVAGLSKTRDVDGMHLYHSPASKQSWYYRYGGLWGSVILEKKTLLCCERICVEPNLQQETAFVEVVVNNRNFYNSPFNLKLVIFDPKGDEVLKEIADLTAQPGRSTFTYHVKLDDPIPWDCDSPALYTIRIQVKDSRGNEDTAQTTFGMRDFTIANGEFFLNGEPIYIKGILLQPNYPINLVTPPNYEMMVREIKLVKEAGFNLIRMHIRPAPEGFLDLADELGILIYAETPLAWIKDNPRLFDHGRREIKAMIERDRNHPSVVIWGIHNENRNVDKLSGGAFARFIRALDPTRVILSNSGGSFVIDQDYGWVNRTSVVPNRKTEHQKFQDLHIYIGTPISTKAYEWLKELGLYDPSVDMFAEGFGTSEIYDEFYRELQSFQGKVFVSELGCGGMVDLDVVVAGFGDQQHLLDAEEARSFRDSLHKGFHERNLEQVFNSVEKMVLSAQRLHAQGNKRQIEALFCNPRISGYILTQLNDVSYEFHAGILDLWRNPKLAYDALKQLNKPHCMILHPETPVVGLGDPIRLDAVLVDWVSLDGSEEVHIHISAPCGKELKKIMIIPPGGSGIKKLGKFSIDSGSTPGEYLVLARLANGEETLAETTEVVLVVETVNIRRKVDSVAWMGSLPNWLSLILDQNKTTQMRAESDRQNKRVLAVPAPDTLDEVDWSFLFSSLDQGGTIIIGSLEPGDSKAISALRARGLDIELNMSIGSWMGCHHWVPKVKIFEGLPAGDFAGEVYKDSLPRYGLSELGGEVLAGSIKNTQTRHESPIMVWYSDIETIRYGNGRIIFCQYRLFTEGKPDPLKTRMIFNLLDFALE
jgi:hypothetical protein